MEQGFVQVLLRLMRSWIFPHSGLFTVKWRDRRKTKIIPKMVIHYLRRKSQWMENNTELGGLND